MMIKNASFKQTRWRALFAASLLPILNACSQSYVVLLADEDGSLGKVSVTNNQGSTVLEKNLEGADLSGSAGQVYAVSQARIQQDFGSALASSPQKPLSYYLYFEGGSTQLTPESAADVPKIIAEIKRRPVPDISVVGHTDTVGDEKLNAALSLQRAEAIATLFTETLPDTDKISIESHGEKNLLIATPDNTDEPKNRRVEVTVR
ncbi:OmpA family protein [Methylomonas sp. HYX-M1]|uniref:OmpA family protein n=1 Tax=Methylomonas sp. HYX-M1 TaxID=3139307 RepID=UPI00345B76FA